MDVSEKVFHGSRYRLAQLRYLSPRHANWACKRLIMPARVRHTLAWGGGGGAQMFGFRQREASHRTAGCIIRSMIRIRNV
jgi:hypothetical protein